MPELSLQARLAKHLLRLIKQRSRSSTIEQRRAMPDLAGRLRQKRHPDMVIVPAVIGGVNCEWVFRRAPGRVAALLAADEPLALEAAFAAMDEGSAADGPQAVDESPEAAMPLPDEPYVTVALPEADVPPAADASQPAALAPATGAAVDADSLADGTSDAAGAVLAMDEAGKASQVVIVYFHGGGYVTGSLLSARAFATSLAFDMPVRLLSVDYRLAPEHPFPAALQDALAVYDALLADGWKPEHIGLVGDSAGGGLALAAAMAIRDRKRPLPGCLALISPWTDLTGRSPSFTAKADEDVMLIPEEIIEYAQFYAGENRPDNPYMSPVYGRFEGLPPMLIHVGGEEMLLDDARRVVAAAKAAGVNAELKVWPGLFHVFSLAADLLPEAQASMSEIMDFLRLQLISRPGEAEPSAPGIAG